MNNNQIANPKVEMPTGINLNDKDYITCLITTLKEMAKKVGISYTYYWQIENKERNLYYYLAIKIAKIFNLKPDDIFYEW